MQFRDGVPLRDVARQMGLSKNTIRRWLREPSTGEPKYAKRVNNSVVDRVDYPRSLRTRAVARRRNAILDVFANRLAIHVQSSSDGRDAQPLPVQSSSTTDTSRVGDPSVRRQHLRRTPHS